MRVNSIRRANLIACCVAATAVGWLASALPWAGSLFALWSALPLLVGVPVAITASSKSQQIASSCVTALSLCVGLYLTQSLSRSVDAFTPLVAWALPAMHLVGVIALLTAVLTMVTFLKPRADEN